MYHVWKLDEVVAGIEYHRERVGPEQIQKYVEEGLDQGTAESLVRTHRELLASFEKHYERLKQRHDAEVFASA